MPRPLPEQVVVVVGASSGIGRLTALELGRRGAAVVVAARDAAALAEVAGEVAGAGGRSLAVPVDVGQWDQVADLAARAVERFGRIDTWISLAATSVYGEVAAIPVEDLEQVIRVDLLGQVYGVKAALPVLRAQGGGTIIGVTSGLGVRSVPLQAAYCASKRGLEGFYESLRVEERRAGSGVQVTTILPASVNTPFFDQARSWMGVRPAPFPPVYQPEVVAEAIVAAVERPTRQVFVGAAAAQLALLERLSPALLDRLSLVGDQAARRQQRGEPDRGQGNLRQPLPGPRSTHGSFGRFALRRSPYTRWLALHPGRGRAATAGAALGAWLAVRRRARR